MMEQLEPARIASIISQAPTWARLGLVDRDSRMRERAAETLAAILVDRLSGREPDDARQMTLPLL